MNDQKKKYFTIGEATTLVGVKQHILRYWEQEFPQLRPRKNRAGNRAYTESDIETALKIKQLLHGERFTIEGAKRHLREEKSAPAPAQTAIPFERMRVTNELREIRAELKRLVEIVNDLGR